MKKSAKRSGEDGRWLREEDGTYRRLTRSQYRAQLGWGCLLVLFIVAVGVVLGTNLSP